MNIKNITIIFCFFLLLSCGFEPIYSKKIQNNYNFSINKIDFEGKNEINQILINNLKNYLNSKEKAKAKVFDLKIYSKITKAITSKNKKGNPELYEMEITIDIEAFDNQILKGKTIFKENFEYKNLSNKYNLDQYENNLQKSLMSEISNRIILYLYSL